MDILALIELSNNLSYGSPYVLLLYSLLGTLGRTHSINKFLKARAAVAAQQRQMEGGESGDGGPPPPPPPPPASVVSTDDEEGSEASEPEDENSD